MFSPEVTPYLFFTLRSLSFSVHRYHTPILQETFGVGVVSGSKNLQRGSLLMWVSLMSTDVN